MHRPGHLGVALLAWAPIGALLSQAGLPGTALVGLAIVVSVFMLPDIDLKTPFLTHRGFSHTVWFALLAAGAIGAAGWYVGGTSTAAISELTREAGMGPQPYFALCGFAFTLLGVLSHLAADSLTPMGVPLLWPLSGTDYSLDVCVAKSRLWNLGLLSSGLVTGGVVVKYGTDLLRASGGL